MPDMSRDWAVHRALRQATMPDLLRNSHNLALEIRPALRLVWDLAYWAGGRGSVEPRVGRGRTVFDRAPVARLLARGADELEPESLRDGVGRRPRALAEDGAYRTPSPAVHLQSGRSVACGQVEAARHDRLTREIDPRCDQLRLASSSRSNPAGRKLEGLWTLEPKPAKPSVFGPTPVPQKQLRLCRDCSGQT